ncbi:hypothetical protein JCM10207_001145 [Rhodosporidiobolus poonsookiae]
MSPVVATVVPHVVQLAAKQSAVDKAEKARLTAASLKYTNIYVWILSCFIFLLVLRNFLLITQRFIARRRSKTEDFVEKGSSKGAGSVIYGQKPFLLRLSDRVDGVLLKPVNLPGIPADWTYLRALIVTALVALNIGFSLVICVTPIAPQSAFTSIPRAFSRRCGRLAVANYPFLFTFAGRNNIIATLTGITYQDLRFYHIFLGGVAFIHSFIHTFAYIGHYTVWQGVEKLREEYTELYFKLGIVALVFMATNCIFGLKWLRRRSYEIFLILHIVGAALILAGSWYHRPIIHTWVYATVAIWAFERVTRFVFHCASIVNTRFILRRPVIRARATVVNGAIKLSVPFPSGTWAPGQHAYISFWGLDLLRRPWLYGQAHPFSISNTPVESADGQQELRFVLRIHKGLTRELANHIVARSQAKGLTEATADCLVSLEGPHGWAPRAEEFDSVLLIAGGSGITHPLGILADVCKQAAVKTAVTSNVKLCWALQQLDQTAWVEETLDQARLEAEKANLPLAVNLYITRSASPASSGTSTPLESPSIDFDEKKSDFGEEVRIGAGKARRFTGRPDIQEEITQVVAQSAGRTLIVACGPAALADEVRRVTTPFLASSVEVQIAKFEC